ncbi:MAG: hypothetical protein ACRD0H_03225, partial [Actinomycetes bacterium]
MASLAEHYDDADTAEELEGAAAAGDGAPPVRYACPWSSLTAPVNAGQGNLTTSALIRRWIEAGLAADGPASGDRV